VQLGDDVLEVELAGGRWRLLRADRVPVLCANLQTDITRFKVIRA
jgi:hypothetical protein